MKNPIEGLEVRLAEADAVQAQRDYLTEFGLTMGYVMGYDPDNEADPLLISELEESEKAKSFGRIYLKEQDSQFEIIGLEILRRSDRITLGHILLICDQYELPFTLVSTYEEPNSVIGELLDQDEALEDRQKNKIR